MLMELLVTGGLGYIGSAFCIGIIRALPEAHVVSIDISDNIPVRNILEQNGIIMYQEISNFT